MTAQTTTELVSGASKSKDHHFINLHQIQISIVEAIRKCHPVAVLDLQHALDNITSAINHAKAA